jgi:hypothetical protein
MWSLRLITNNIKKNSTFGTYKMLVKLTDFIIIYENEKKIVNFVC